MKEAKQGNLLTIEALISKFKIQIWSSKGHLREKLISFGSLEITLTSRILNIFPLFLNFPSQSFPNTTWMVCLALEKI